MADKTLIGWSDATWNPITGCSVLSPGCKNCYAMTLAGGRMRNHPSRAGLTSPSSAGPVWNGKVRLNKGWLTQPLLWKKPRKVFTGAHTDLFYEGVPDEWILDVFTIQAIAGWHVFQSLTKRSERCAAWLLEPGRLDEIYANWHTFSGSPAEVWSWPLHNVWMGFSAERQLEFDARWAHMRDLAEAGWTIYVSAEPLLGPIVLPADFLALGHKVWVIAGGESGRRARPMHPHWARQLRDQCAAAGIPFFFKQWGEFRPTIWTDDTPDREPEFSMAFNGELDRERPFTLPDRGGPRPRWCTMSRFGGKAAGNLLDGELHEAFPALKEAA